MIRKINVKHGDELCLRVSPCMMWYSVYDVVFFMLGVLDLQKCVFYFVRLYYVIQQSVIDIFHVMDCEYCKCINVILKK